MSSPTRILFLSGEVTPFTQASALSDLTRDLAEPLQDVQGLDARLMIPCYGFISERKHRLHDVIRLSGTEVPMGTGTEEVNVKVASLPDTRMQTYFMDHAVYFNRDGVAHTNDGTAFDDNATRAAFFNRAVLETLRTLRWRPDVIHAFGWMGGLAPLLMSTAYAGDDLLEGIPVVFTPDVDAAPDPLANVPKTLHAKDQEDTLSLNEAGRRWADAVVHAPTDVPEGEMAFLDASEDRVDQLLSLYSSLLDEVPA